jgi:hypothetical protein
MILCDNVKCNIGWYHAYCIDMPRGRERDHWFCDACQGKGKEDQQDTNYDGVWTCLVNIWARQMFQSVYRTLTISDSRRRLSLTSGYIGYWIGHYFEKNCLRWYCKLVDLKKLYCREERQRTGTANISLRAGNFCRQGGMVFTISVCQPVLRLIRHWSGLLVHRSIIKSPHTRRSYVRSAAVGHKVSICRRSDLSKRQMTGHPSHPFRQRSSYLGT